MSINKEKSREAQIRLLSGKKMVIAMAATIVAYGEKKGKKTLISHKLLGLPRHERGFFHS